MPYTNSKAADQPTHSGSLISAFVVRYLDSVLPIGDVCGIWRLLLVSVTVQAGLSPTRSQTPEDRFSCDVAH